MAVEAAMEQVLDQPSLYPELPRKSREERRRDLEEWYGRYQEVNASYNLYGLDVEGLRNPEDYLDNGIFKTERYKANSTFYPHGSSFPYDYTVIMRDKRLFDSYYSRLMPGSVPETLGYIVQGRLLIFDGHLDEQDLDSFSALHDGERLAVKQTFGCHGENLISCVVKDGMVEHGGQSEPLKVFLRGISSATGSMWIVQKWMSQHKVLSSFNETSINAVRLVTYNTGIRVVVSKASLLAGPQGSFINNPQEGTETLYGVSLSGIVSDKAYRFATCSKVDTPHAGVSIPYFKQACELVTQAHSFIPEVFSVGWDVVIGEAGPILLEGNDGWSPRAIQFPNQEGERKNWNTYLAERREVWGSR